MKSTSLPFPIFDHDVFMDTCRQHIAEHPHVHVSPLPGCSQEWFIYHLASSFKKSLYIVSDESQYETVFSHFNAVPETYKKNLRIHCIPYAGENLHRQNLISLNDKLIASTAFLDTTEASLFVATLASIRESFPFISKHIHLHNNQHLRREKLVERLVQLNYAHQPFIESPHEFAVRGNIVDIFSIGHALPVRIEYHDNTIIHMREFDPSTQSSIRSVGTMDIYAFLPDNQRHSFYQMLSHFSHVFTHLPSISEELSHAHIISISGEYVSHETAKILKSPYTSCLIPFTPGLNFIDASQKYIYSLPVDFDIYFYCETQGEVNRLQTILERDTKQKIQFFPYPIQKGFQSQCGRKSFISANEIFQRAPSHFLSVRPTKSGLRKEPTLTFEQGDLVVHHTYGVGKFLGTKQKPSHSDPGIVEEVMVIEYANTSYLHVPKENFYLLEKYVGTHETKPHLDELGTKAWQRKKNSAMEAIADYAAKILKLEASRSEITTDALSVTSDYVTNFELSFPYLDTPDQEIATRDIHCDLASGKLMNRLILGDVGYGKTELAFRAVFINAYSGYQTAILAPTTLLAQQHYQNVLDRMKEYPLNIAVLSRFTSAKEQKKILQGLSEGKIDIVIGTHRLLQKDIVFKRLNLLVIDEEQKFGVEQKDSIIVKNPNVHILSLSATPIPRTLYLSLMGARNMSAIFTPPKNRLPVDVKILGKDHPEIYTAMRMEINRGGQIFYVHNRVYNIEGIKEKLESQLPDIRFAVAHGQMNEHALKETMINFMNHRIDCLIATSIIESGLDFPNVNTLIVNEAHHFGLADLYQLKGRVGRHDRKAFAYFIVPKTSTWDSKIKKKIKALESFSLPGGGYHVALKDLELRGAGNILGTEQSGHIANIGFELYCRLLKETLKVLRNEPFIPFYDVEIILGEEGAIPSDFITAFQDRFQLMKSLSLTQSLDELENIKRKMNDQFGSFPLSVHNLFLTYEIKILARQKLIVRIEKLKSKFALSFKHTEIKFVPDNRSKNENIFEFVKKLIELI